MPKNKLVKIFEVFSSEPRFCSSASPQKRRRLNRIFCIFGILLIAAGGLLFFNCHTRFDAIMSGFSILAGAAILGCLYNEYQNSRITATPTSESAESNASNVQEDKID